MLLVGMRRLSFGLVLLSEDPLDLLLASEVLEKARQTFESERVTDEQTVQTIKKYYRDVNYILDPHTAVGVNAAARSMSRTSTQTPHLSLSTAHPVAQVNMGGCHTVSLQAHSAVAACYRKTVGQ